MPAAKVEAAPDSPGKKGKFWEPRSTPQDKYKTVSNLDEMSEQETLMNELTGEGGEEDGEKVTYNKFTDVSLRGVE